MATQDLRSQQAQMAQAAAMQNANQSAAGAPQAGRAPVGGPRPRKSTVQGGGPTNAPSRGGPPTRQVRPMSNTTATKPTMSAGLMQQSAMNAGRTATSAALQMAAQRQSNPTAAATGEKGFTRLMNPAGGAANRPVVISQPTLGFDERTMTVEGRIQGLMDSDNPIMQQARLQAQQESAARGLQNSSMAVQSGQQAAYASMMPIAQQDANTAYDREKTEYGTRSDQALMREDNRNKMGLQEQAFGFDRKLQDADFAGRQSLQTDEQTFTTARDAEKFRTDTELQGQDIQGRKDLQTSQQEFTTGRDAEKFRTDTLLADQEIEARTLLQRNDLTSREKIAEQANQTTLKTTKMRTDAQRDVAAVSASATIASASISAASQQATAKIQIQGTAMLNAQTQAYTKENQTTEFRRDRRLQTERINGQLSETQNKLDANQQVSYATGVTNLQLGVQREHSAVAQNPDMSRDEKAAAHKAIDDRFERDTQLQRDMYEF